MILVHKISLIKLIICCYFLKIILLVNWALYWFLNWFTPENPILDDLLKILLKILIKFLLKSFLNQMSELISQPSQELKFWKKFHFLQTIPVRFFAFSDFFDSLFLLTTLINLCDDEKVIKFVIESLSESLLYESSKPQIQLLSENRLKYSSFQHVYSDIF